MTPRLVVRSAAEANVTDAALWYEARAAGLGADFLRGVDVVLAEIQRMPERFRQRRALPVMPKALGRPRPSCCLGALVTYNRGGPHTSGGTP